MAVKGKVGFVILLILITSLIVALCFVLLWPEQLERTIGTSLRWKRTSQLPEQQQQQQQAPKWINEMIETNSNKTLIRTEENVLLNALGQLEISSPEDVMTYITLDAGCKKLKRYRDVFEKNHKDVPDSVLYVRLFRSITTFHTLYCGRDERYRRIFAELQDELLGLHEEFLDCNGQPDWYETTNSTVVCATAEGISNCYAHKLRAQIDDVAAVTVWTCVFQSVLNAAMLTPCNFSRVLNSADAVNFSTKSSQVNCFFILLLCSFVSFFNIF